MATKIPPQVEVGAMVGVKVGLRVGCSVGSSIDGATARQEIVIVTSRRRSSVVSQVNPDALAMSIQLVTSVGARIENEVP